MLFIKHWFWKDEERFVFLLTFSIPLLFPLFSSFYRTLSDFFDFFENFGIIFADKKVLWNLNIVILAINITRPDLRGLRLIIFFIYFYLIINVIDLTWPDWRGLYKWKVKSVKWKVFILNFTFFTFHFSFHFVVCSSARGETINKKLLIFCRFARRKLCL